MFVCEDNAFVTTNSGCLTCVRFWVTIGEQVKKNAIEVMQSSPCKPMISHLAHLALAVQVSAEGTKFEGFQEKLRCIGQWLPPLGMLQVRRALNHLSFAYLKFD
jgi:hypothetical protein